MLYPDEVPGRETLTRFQVAKRLYLDENPGHETLTNFHETLKKFQVAKRVYLDEFQVMKNLDEVPGRKKVIP